MSDAKRVSPALESTALFDSNGGEIDPTAKPKTPMPSPKTTAVRASANHPTVPSSPGTGVTTQISKPTSGDPLIGMRLRHFRINKLLGKGGMGSVYLGHDTSLDRPVALKVLAPEIATDGEMVTRFVREARAQARLRHPNVVQIYFIGEDQGLHFFAMEFVDGPPLDAVLETGQAVPWDSALKYIEQAAKGLRAALAEGFIHRDVKPSNLLVDNEGHVKLADFGLVKSMHGDTELTRQGVIVGSPLYMAPEQGRGEEVDHRSDIYSLGCTLYHFVTGQPPFQSESPVAVMSMHVTDMATRIRAFRPDVPESVERLVDRMMSKIPGHRYETYDQLLGGIEMARPVERQDTSFWKRALALVIDCALLAPLAAFVSVFLAPAAIVLGTVGVALWGQTPGKWAVGLVVRDSDGTKLNWKKAFLRAAVAMWGIAAWAILLSVLYLVHRHDHYNITISRLTLENLVVPIVYIGGLMLILLCYVGSFLLAVFHPRHFALHDIAAKSQVRDIPAFRGLRTLRKKKN